MEDIIFGDINLCKANYNIIEIGEFMGRSYIRFCSATSLP